MATLPWVPNRATQFSRIEMHRLMTPNIYLKQYKRSGRGVV
ncbi:hypothetical protein RE6C_05083 [Rhodopirellula europaea 6C]|uniref:Uncharacterized protein n=1 Tax=Rhodopirellula europaea 6C TaxID=1263867 RepID=M2ABP3_9BACT|nr:hypothetical protein RE6C_05083 [Rhodopirellula europaea 6C]